MYQHLKLCSTIETTPFTVRFHSKCAITNSIYSHASTCQHRAVQPRSDLCWRHFSVTKRLWLYSRTVASVRDTYATTVRATTDLKSEVCGACHGCGYAVVPCCSHRFLNFLPRIGAFNKVFLPPSSPAQRATSHQLVFEEWRAASKRAARASQPPLCSGAGTTHRRP